MLQFFSVFKFFFLKAYEATILWENLTAVGLYVAGVALLTGVIAFIASKFALKKSNMSSAVRGIICLAVSLALYFGLLTVNNLMFNGTQNKIFAGGAFLGIAAMSAFLLTLLSGKTISREHKKNALCYVLSAVILLASPCVALLACIIPMSYADVSAVGFTDGEPITAQSREYCFDNNSLLIGGYCWGDDDNSPVLVELAKQAGFDFLISNCTDEAFLTSCDEQNLGIILSQPSNNKNSFFLPRTFQTSSDEVYETWSGFTSEQYLSSATYLHKCIWGNSFVDEPFRPQFESIAKGVENYYNNTEGKLPYVNQVPFTSNKNLELETDALTIRSLPLLNRIDWINDYVARYKMFISDYINTVDTDYLCFDIYPLKVAKDIITGDYVYSTEELWLRNLDMLADACRKTNRDLWVITQASGEVDDSAEITKTGARFTDTPEDIRWQYYVSLSFGAKAIINSLYYSGWWEPNSHMINSQQQTTATYNAVKTVNFEFKPIIDVYGSYKSLGVFITNGKKAAGNKTNTFSPLTEGAVKPEITTVSPVLTGCFESADSSSKAYTFVNMWEPGTGKTAEAEVKFEGAKEITVYRSGKTETTEGNVLNITLDSGEGIFVTVK